MNTLPKKYRCVTFDLSRAKELINEGRCVAISYCQWQELQHMVCKPISLRGIFDTDDYGKIVVLHR